MSKNFLIVLGVIVILFGGLLFFNKKEANGPSGNGGDTQAALSENKTAEGSTGVTLIEYGDFECPACAQYFPLFKQLKTEYAGKVTFQFRHYPLTEIHQNALITSRAAQAAALQGKFWEMHDLLYENQQAWKSNTNPTPLLESYAKQIGLDVAKFGTDMRSEAVNDTIQADRADARNKGYTSTPTFVLDGKKIDDNPRSYEEFKKLIDDAIAARQNS